MIEKPLHKVWLGNFSKLNISWIKENSSLWCGTWLFFCKNYQVARGSYLQRIKFEDCQDNLISMFPSDAMKSMRIKICKRNVYKILLLDLPKCNCSQPFENLLLIPIRQYQN